MKILVRADNQTRKLWYNSLIQKIMKTEYAGHTFQLVSVIF